MELPGPLSPKANAFSIASIMSGPLEAMFVPGPGGYPPSSVPPQRSTDCFWDWNTQYSHAVAAAAAQGPYGPAAMKGMEGK